METREIRSYKFRTKENPNFIQNLLIKTYMEYLGDNIFLSETFEVLGDYIEITERQAYHYNYKDLYLIYSELFK